MQNYYVTFGQKYHREPHPTLGDVPTLPDQWLRVRAEDEEQARDIVVAYLGQQWSSIYDEIGFEVYKGLYPEGEYAVLEMTIIRRDTVASVAAKVENVRRIMDAARGQVDG